MKSTPIETDQEQSLARAILYRLSAHSLRQPGEAWREEWNEIARGMGAGLEALAGVVAIDALWDAFDPLPGIVLDLDEIEADHLRLFGHTPRAGATPYETEWTGASGQLLQYHLLSDLGAFYRAFGLDLSRTCDERQDHVAVELSFMHFLAVKEAYAIERGLDDLREACRAGETRFFEEHLARWTPAFCRILERSDSRFYGRAGRLLKGFLETETLLLGADAIDRVERIGETSMTLEECCVGCGVAASCMDGAPVPPREG